MTDSLSSQLIAHLWQSTVVIGVVALITFALRGNRARVRYWLWKAASVKFLVPFSWLVSLGAQFEWPTAPPMAQPTVAFVMEEILAPPVAAAAIPAPAAPLTSTWPWVLASVWVIGLVGVLFWWWRQWRLVHAALRDAKPVEAGCARENASLRVMSSAWAFEPGVVGIWRPVLLLPEGLVERLTPAQLNAVIAHERCHIRSHDNLAAAIHMLVEALFWFHPLVWWIERRLIQERERACDEAVLQGGSDPDDYAAGLLTVCRFTLRTPLACVAGVSGADLRTRIESIVRQELGARLTIGRRVALALAAATLVIAPIVSGVLRIGTPLLAVGQEPSTPVVFEVASVRRNTSGETAAQWDDMPGGRFVATNATLKMLILEAYRIPRNQLVNAPGWTETERFDVNAKLEREAPIAAPAARGEPGDRQFALRSLLAERFKLVVHRETRDVAMYALVMARADRKPGPMLRPSSTDCSPAAMEARGPAAQAGQVLGVCGWLGSSGGIQGGGRTMAAIARSLSGAAAIGRNVIDRTGLTGTWDFELTFTPDLPQQPRPKQEPRAVDSDGPSLITALQEQLGLKLESIRGPMEFLVVDRVERLEREDTVDVK